MDFFHITLADFQVFQEVYRQRSINKAAQELFTSRQSIARSIQNIETTLQHELFVRTPQGTFPTEFAIELLPHVEPLLEAAQALVRFTDSYDRTSKPINFGLLGQYQTGQFIESLLKEYEQAHPDTYVSVSHCDWPDILSYVEDGKLDMAYIAIVNKYVGPSLCKLPLTSDEFVIVTAKGTPLADNEKVRGEQLAGLKPVMYTRYDIQVGMLEDYAQQHGLDIAEPITTADLFLVGDYVYRPDCAVMLLGYVAKNLVKRDSNVVIRPLEPTLHRVSGLVYRRDMFLNENHRAIIKLLKHELR